MNIATRISQIEDEVAAIRNVRWAEAKATGSPARSREIGMAFEEEVRERRNEIAALRGPIVSLVVHEGRLLLATSGGVFEIVGDKMTYVPMHLDVKDAA